MQKFKQLNLHQRYQIEALLQAGNNQTKTAMRMNNYFSRNGLAFVTISIVLTVNCPDVLAQDMSEKGIIEVVDSFHAAIVAGDSIAALDLLAEDVVILESGGL